MRVYRFLNQRWGLEALRQRRLKIARIEELNDPFELLGLNLRDKDLRRAMKKVKEALSRTTGIICFSKEWSNPLLWSHYADAHRGICLGFEVRTAEPVRYNAQRLVPSDDWLYRNDTRRIEDMTTFLCTKFEHWKYEREVRVFYQLTDRDPEAGHYFADFSNDLTLAQVILGANSAVSPQELVDAVGDGMEHIELIKARLAFKAFSVVPDRRHPLSMWTLKDAG